MIFLNTANRINLAGSSIVKATGLLFVYNSAEIIVQISITFRWLCGRNNSLLKPELETLPYPNTEKVNNLIKSYFENNLFKMEEKNYGIETK